jgi:hypothetical protein
MKRGMFAMTAMACLAGTAAVAAQPEPPIQTGQGHRFACTDYSQGKVFIVSAAGQVEWEYKTGACNDRGCCPTAACFSTPGPASRK